jgi:hypothetical protein
LTNSNRLRFRVSNLGVADAPSTQKWDASMFTKTQNFLPGIPANDLMEEVTYPRFVNIDDDLLLTYRIGQSVFPSILPPVITQVVLPIPSSERA